MKKLRKTGISLIVMLITIVVIIILAASIINTVIYNNPMSNAKEATFRSDLQEIKNAYGIRQGDLMAKYKGDKTKIKEEDYAGVVHKNYEGEILAFEGGLAYLGEDKQKQEIAESMDYIIGNPNDSVLKATINANFAFWEDKYKTKITKVKFITKNKVPSGVVESWDVSVKNNGAVMAWVVNDGNGGYELTIGGNGKVIANRDSRTMFRNFSAVKEIDIKALDTSNITSMFCMFNGCINLTSLDLSNFDASNVENMWWTFRDCINLKSINFGNKFDTSKVKDMYRMFNGCRSLTSLDLSSFDTSSLTNMNNMFDGCSSLTSLDISNFDTSNVTAMGGLFDGCYKLKTNITIKNAETNVYEKIFTYAATEEGAEITVNYTTETSDLVDKMIETKSPNSNVKKGELVS